VLVETDDLIDAHEVAHMLGLAQRNSVSGYLRKYPDMPRPVIDLGPNRPHLWLRPEVEDWLRRRGTVRRGRPPKQAAVPPPRPAKAASRRPRRG
jgi:glutathione-regulated potassium-efflux system ancillary protein KefG